MKIEIGENLPAYFRPAYPEEFELFSHFEVAAGIPTALFAITTWKENGLPNVCFHAWSAFHGDKTAFFAVIGNLYQHTHTYQNILRERFAKDFDTGMLSPFAIAAMVAAYEEGEEWLEELNRYLDESLVLAVENIREKLPRAKAYVPQGSYVLWVDFSGYGYTPEKLQALVNQKANVAVQSGLAHGPEQGGSYLRLCLTSPKAAILTAIERIAAALQEGSL